MGMTIAISREQAVLTTAQAVWWFMAARCLCETYLTTSQSIPFVFTPWMQLLGFK
jgi:hypothetical protein